MKKWMILGMLILAIVFNNSAMAQEGRNVSEYNLNEQGVGFIDGNSRIAEGFDPVSVFPEGGSQVQKGKNDFAVMHKGVEYLFANAQNMKSFLANPEKFEPTYGGWCARAMVVGQKVHINTKLFTVVGNRSFFFVNTRAKNYFDRNILENAKLADDYWKQISGESPRL